MDGRRPLAKDKVFTRGVELIALRGQDPAKIAGRPYEDPAFLFAVADDRPPVPHGAMPVWFRLHAPKETPTYRLAPEGPYVSPEWVVPEGSGPLVMARRLHLVGDLWRLRAQIG